jgi:hypothetical protein
MASLLASSNALAQVHGRTPVSVIGSIHPGSPHGLLPAVSGVGIAPVVGKPRSSVGQWHCIPGAFGNCGFGTHHRLSPIDGVGVAPVVGKPLLSGPPPWQDS